MQIFHELCKLYALPAQQVYKDSRESLLPANLSFGSMLTENILVISDIFIGGRES